MATAWPKILLAVLAASLAGEVAADVGVNQSTMDGLFNHIFANYNKYVRPIVPGGLVVEVEIVLGNFIEISTAQETIEFEGWWRFYWTDPRLSWDAEEWNIRELGVDGDLLWNPDVIVYQHIHDIPTKVGASVTSKGQILYSLPRRTKLSCPMQVKTFPFDRQVCNFTVGSWSLNGVQLDVAPRKRDLSSVISGDAAPTRSAIDLSTYKQMEPWRLHAVRVLWKNQYYGCCPEPYPVLVYELELHRASRTFFSGVIAPMILVTVIGFASFLMPAPLSGARPALCVTILLTTVTVYNVASRATPNTDQSTLVSRLYVAGMVLAGAQVLLSIVATALNQISPGRRSNNQALVELFAQYDGEHKGFLTREELSAVLDELQMTDKEKKPVLELVGEEEAADGGGGVMSLAQWKAVGELAKQPDETATYHNVLVKGMVKAALRRGLRKMTANNLNQPGALSYRPGPGGVHRSGSQVSVWSEDEEEELPGGLPPDKSFRRNPRTARYNRRNGPYGDSSPASRHVGAARPPPLVSPSVVASHSRAVPPLEGAPARERWLDSLASKEDVTVELSCSFEHPDGNGNGNGNGASSNGVRGRLRPEESESEIEEGRGRGVQLSLGAASAGRDGGEADAVDAGAGVGERREGGGRGRKEGLRLVRRVSYLGTSTAKMFSLSDSSAKKATRVLCARLGRYCASEGDPQRTGRQLAACVDAWAFAAMLPCYALYLIIEAAGVLSDQPIQPHEIGLGGTLRGNGVEVQFYDLRTEPGAARCFDFTPRFSGVLGELDLARQNCQWQR